MLDRVKLVAQVSKSASQIANNQDLQISLALTTWQKILLDPKFKTNLLAANLPFSVPAWQGELGQIVRLEPQKFDYKIVSCDGSQIYPDRHMGSNFYLINTGVVTLRYQVNSSISIFSNPYFFTDIGQIACNIADYVDNKRHELEMQDGYKAVLHELEFCELRSKNVPVIYLVDGSLIAWHLFGKSDNLCEQFLPTYLNQLKLFLVNKIPVIGYVSLPNSTDLIALLRAQLCDFNSSSNQATILAGMVDSDLLAYILPVGAFTNWFISQVAAIKDYPQDLKIYFTYFNTGHEIARIELPEFVFLDQALLTLSMQVILDQVGKGYGYPVVLSEAHQQAVIKSPDRDFFYQVIKQFAPVKNQNNQISRKLKHKQMMNF